MLEKLLERLNAQLADCKRFQGNHSYQKTWFDQAFGMVTLFAVLYPDLAAEVENIWMTEYRPEFEKVLYGID